MSNVNSVTKHFPTVNEGFTSTLSALVASGGATIVLNSIGTLVNGTVFVGIIEPGETNQQLFTGTVDTSTNSITGVVWTRGTNIDHPAGSQVVDYVTGTAINMITKGLLVSHNQEGTLKGSAVADAIAGTNLVAPSAINATYGLFKQTVVKTTTGTYAKPVDLKFVVVELVGGGGAGGNTSSTGAGEASAAGAGGGGGYAVKKYLASALLASETVTVGTGGARTGASAADGQAGTDTTFKTTVASGGGGGIGSGVTGTSGFTAGGLGGSFSGADYGSRGGPGFPGTIIAAVPTRTSLGGSSHYSGNQRTIHNAHGIAGADYGAGGGGTSNTASVGAAYQGGAGADGVVLIHEYF